MPVAKLSQNSIDKLAAPRKTTQFLVYWDQEFPGFGVRVYASERKKYVIKYREHGKQRYKDIGLTQLLSLAEARAEAKKLLAFVLVKPLVPELPRAKPCIFFTRLCEEYIERHAKAKKRSWLEDARRIKNYLLPEFGHLTLTQITPGLVHEFHDRIGRDKPFQANRLIENLRKMFNLAVKWEYLPAGAINPAQGVEPFEEPPRDNWFTPGQVNSLMLAVAQEEDQYLKAAIWILLLTGQRKNEILKLRWEDVCLERRTMLIRRENSKNKKPHEVSLSEPAYKILASLERMQGNPYVIVGKKPGQHRNTIDKAWQRIRKKAGLPDAQIHDIRHTVGSWLIHNGFELPLVGRVLNQSSLSATLKYIHFAKADTRIALELVGEKVEESIARICPYLA